MKRIIVAPNSKTLALSMAGMDSATRAAFQEALERRREEMGQISDENQTQHDAIMEAEKESKLADIIPKLYPLWERIQRRKDQKNDLTLKEYQNITGKQYPAHIIKDKQGREYVSWDNAIDNIAAEYGYDSPELLYNDLERLVQARHDAEGYRELSEITSHDLKGIEKSIGILNKVKEGKYDIQPSTDENEQGAPESNKVVPTNQETSPQAAVDAGRNEATGGNKAARENTVVKDVQAVFDEASKENAMVRTTSGHWQKVDGHWHFFKDIQPGDALKAMTPTMSRKSFYLSVVKPPATPKLPRSSHVAQPHIVPQHRTRKGQGLTRRSDR